MRKPPGFHAIICALALGALPACAPRTLSTPVAPPLPAGTAQAPTVTPDPAVRIHFLGHAAFGILFSNGTRLLADYGEASGTGWSTEIFPLNDFQPDIVTYSQTQHADHYLPLDFGDATVLTGDVAQTSGDVFIQSIPTHELSMAEFDSTGYVFTYNGLTILHMGEPLQYILNIDDPAVRQEVQRIYPGPYDVILLPLSGLQVTPDQLEAFIDALKPKRVILMHARSPFLCPAFLTFLEEQRADKNYQTLNVDESVFDLYFSSPTGPGPTVMCLQPGPY